jgi:hypothetical protein
MIRPAALDRPTATAAGLLYLTVIACGLTAELGLRAGLAVPGDPGATAANLLAAPGRFRLSVALDTLMALADVALAVLLFHLFRPAGPLLAALAAAFRLVQTAVVASGLAALHGAVRLLDAGALPADTAAALAALRLEDHAHGYDLGLAFFALACALLGVLIRRSGAGWLGLLVMAAGAVYLTGTALRVLAPELAAGFAPAYAVPLLSEVGLCLWLLGTGILPQRR